MKSFFVGEHVGLHVPYDLVGQKLRGLRRPHQIVGHIPHRVIPGGLHQLRYVEQYGFRWELSQHFHRVLSCQWVRREQPGVVT